MGQVGYFLFLVCRWAVLSYIPCLFYASITGRGDGWGGDRQAHACYMAGGTEEERVCWEFNWNLLCSVHFGSWRRMGLFLHADNLPDLVC